ncbi:LuxR C-terminal-related transcriptional regulator [Eggerthella sp. YY7918]|uniref:helix-turn-helix transcriptional regulator n=1 Tax=Eggerthella sp. (strain YY7918) TaxID=502558 RepID=UPI0002D3A83E|nr:LuxR C-terminal-related transcriptional regulator [Eggerthella sp. YY7918]
MQSESDMKNRAVSAAEGSRSTQRVVVGWRERRVMLMSFLHEIRIHPRLSIGFGLFWTWVWLVFQTTLFSPAFLNELDFILPGWVVPLTAYALTFLLLGFLFKLKGIVPQGRWYLICVSATMSVGVGICGMLSYSPLTVFSINAVVTCFGGVLMGAGTACLHVEWGRVLGELGPRITILHGVVGTVVAALLTVCITFLPDIAVWIVAVVIPPICMRLLVRDVPVTPALLMHGLDAPLYIPRRFLATSFTQGLSFGIVQAVLLLGGVEGPVVALSAASFALSAIVLFVCALFFRMDFNQLIYQVGFLIMAAGYLVLAVVSPDAPEGLFIHTLGYRFVDIMMWALCTFLINQRGLPANWVFAITTCFLLLGQVVGALIGSGVVYTFDITVHTARDLATVMVFVLLAVSLVMSDRKNLQTGWGMVRPGEMNEMPDSFDRACELVGRRYALTSREQEIFSMLARGSSRADICEELTLSKETVKTHVRNIYRKMGIHSQQDTLAAVVAEQQALGIDEPPEETDMRI